METEVVTDEVVESSLDYSKQFTEMQQSLNEINANLQYSNNQNYFFIVSIFTVLVCCLLYKVIKVFI